MSGYSQGTVSTLLSSSVTLAVSAESLIADDIDLTGCDYVWMLIDVTTDASATDGVELRLYKKTGSSGTKADNYCRVIGVDENQANYDADIGTIEPGIYALYGYNNDSSYTATVNQVRVNKFTYSTT